MYKLLLCQRYLRTRYIALASIISVMLGVATMIVVNSVMAGFGTEMRERIRGILADVVIESNSLNGEYDPDEQMALVREAAGDHVEGMTATVELYGLLTFQYAGQYITRTVTLIGIDPETKAEVGPLVDYLQSYQPEREDGKVVRPAERTLDTPPGWELTDSAMDYRRGWIERQRWFQEQMRLERQQEAEEAAASGVTPAAGLTPDDPFANNPFVEPEAPVVEADPARPLKARVYIGAGLVSYPIEDPETGKVKMFSMVRPGDNVKISTVTVGPPPDTVHFDATVVDCFKSGMSEYDASLVYCNLDFLQEVRGMVHPTTGQRAVTSIQIKLKDYKDADLVVEKLQAAFPLNQFTIRTWEQKQGPLLAAVDVEAAILNVLLFLIIAVAGFGILAIFFMIVVEKTRDIGILKALGASSGGVMTIFLSYGLALGIVGSGVGVAVGLLFVRNINTIESWITWILGRKVFDERIYYFPSIPTDVQPMMVFWVALGAMAIAVLASILPARRAARLKPVEALRYE